ncbi:MAG: hypothetical protein HGA39_06560 [Coriobacteriia bacterium]|nr:hypothetical protein [Coriobacteriia bacterium]
MNSSKRALVFALIAPLALAVVLSTGVTSASAAENPGATAFRRIAKADGLSIAEINAVIQAAYPEIPLVVDPVEVIKQVAAENGYGEADTNALLTIAYRESRYNPDSRSGKYLGMFQLDQSMCEGAVWNDPRWNTQRAIEYVIDRYGTPTEALLHSNQFNWY